MTGGGAAGDSSQAPGSTGRGALGPSMGTATVSGLRAPGGPALASWHRYLHDLEGSQQPVDDRLAVTISAAQAAIAELTGAPGRPAATAAADREGIPGADIPLTAGMVMGALTGRAEDLRQVAQRAYDHAQGIRSRRARRKLEEVGHGHMRQSLDLTLVAERIQDLALESRNG